MTLGLSREEARSLPVSEARDRLEKAAKKAASVPLKSRFESMLDSDDLELFETAKKEVAAMKQFAQKELDGVPLPPPLSEAELNASLARTWPDLVTFTNLLTKEALFRLRILGPAFAEPLKEESRLRRNIYRAWLDFVDGVGLFPEFNIFEPTGGPPVEQGGADVERVYEDLKRRRDDLALTTKQFEEWERKAAKRNLVALPPSSEDEGGEQQKKALSR